MKGSDRREDGGERGEERQIWEERGKGLQGGDKEEVKETGVS